MKPKKSKELCQGCRDNFYNGHNDLGVKECWHYKSAKIVKRFEIGYWTRPTEPGAFMEVYTFNCHNKEGVAFYEKLPSHAVDPIRLEK